MAESSPVENASEPVARRNTHAALEKLLNDMIETPERRPEISREIESLFGQEKAVMVLDMSGFSRTTQRHGIVSFLLMIHQMRLICRPHIEENHGVVIKREADNLFCLFDTVADAVHCSQEIIRHLTSANRLLPETRRLYVSIGIGYGHILNIEDQDMFGDEVNLASKLGEDVAQAEMILLTDAANKQLPEDIETVEDQISISGLVVSFHAVVKD